jgi:hypothetical protein
MRPMSVVVPDVDVQHALELRACGVRKLDRAPYERDDIACRVRKLDRPHESGSAVSEETRASRGRGFETRRPLGVGRSSFAAPPAISIPWLTSRIRRRARPSSPWSASAGRAACVHPRGAKVDW